MLLCKACIRKERNLDERKLFRQKLISHVKCEECGKTKDCIDVKFLKKKRKI